MDLYQVATQTGTALRTITGLRVYEYGTKAIAAPAAVFALPQSLDFHQAYGQGAELLKDAAVIALVRDTERRVAFKQLAAYCKGSGAGTIRAALEGFAWTACDSATVTSVDFDVFPYNGADYLAGIFHVDYFGSGT